MFQTVKCAFMLARALPERLKRNQQLWLLEICWISNLLSVICGAVAFAAPFYPPLHTFINAPSTFLAMFAFANGPLGWSVILLGNKLVGGLKLHLSIWHFYPHSALLIVFRLPIELTPFHCYLFQFTSGVCSRYFSGVS